tara:strand:+ start:191 stop:1108 length:918 start_codon:yes stop_codon:yes gene_type:complete
MISMESMNKPETREKDTITWSDLESQLDNMESVSGGYSDAKRGIITALDGERLFIKVGVSEGTKGWIQKETRVYDFLSQNGFSHIPGVAAKNSDNSAIALEALEANQGWDWSESWDDARLEATLAALDELAELEVPTDNPDLITPILSIAQNGWIELAESEERISALVQKLATKDQEALAKQIQSFAQKTADFTFKKEALVNNDVRADNCAWNAETGEVKLVDWNWLELGDRRADLASMLVHVHQSGYDVLEKHADRLDKDALNWIAGYWLAAASKPIWHGGPESLREFQLDSALTSLELARKLN